MKRVLVYLLFLMFMVMFAGDSSAGWEAPVQTNFYGTNFVWTNTFRKMIIIQSMMFKHDANVSNTVNFYRVDDSSNEFLLETIPTTNALHYAVITPSGNGEIRVPLGSSIMINQTATNTAYVIIDPASPE